MRGRIERLERIRNDLVLFLDTEEFFCRGNIFRARPLYLAVIIVPILPSIDSGDSGSLFFGMLFILILTFCVCRVLFSVRKIGIKDNKLILASWNGAIKRFEIEKANIKCSWNMDGGTYISINENKYGSYIMKHQDIVTLIILFHYIKTNSLCNVEHIDSSEVRKIMKKYS